MVWINEAQKATRPQTPFAVVALRGPTVGQGLRVIPTRHEVEPAINLNEEVEQLRALPSHDTLLQVLNLELELTPEASASCESESACRVQAVVLESCRVRKREGLRAVVGGDVERGFQRRPR